MRGTARALAVSTRATGHVRLSIGRILKEHVCVCRQGYLPPPQHSLIGSGNLRSTECNSQLAGLCFPLVRRAVSVPMTGEGAVIEFVCCRWVPVLFILFSIDTGFGRLTSAGTQHRCTAFSVARTVSGGNTATCVHNTARLARDSDRETRALVQNAA